MTNTTLLVREAVEGDRQKLANLLHFELRVHRHLDWRSPLDWLGYTPFVVAEDQGRIVGALACPVDPPGVAWVQVFAATSSRPVTNIWASLWEKVQSLLRDQKGLILAAIPMQEWLVTLIKQSGFNLANEVVVLSWDYDQPLEQVGELPFTIRPILGEDLEQVWRVDTAAFKALWQNSAASLELALNQSSIATVAEVEGRIIGYQISTSSHMGGHLARLAVLPEYQGRGIGYTLVNDLLKQFVFRGIFRVTVNTQADNLASLRLYEKMGFLRTGEAFPVYVLDPWDLENPGGLPASSSQGDV